MTIADEVSLEKGNAKQIVPSIRHFRHGLHSPVDQDLEQSELEKSLSYSKHKYVQILILFTISFKRLI